MERGTYNKDHLRELSLQVTNALLRVEEDPSQFGEFSIYDTDPHFFEKNWGLKLFEKPLFAVNFSDENLDEPLRTPLDNLIVMREVTLEDDGLYEQVTKWGDYNQHGWDDHLNIYQGNTPYFFGVVRGQGDFGDHETKKGFTIFRSAYSEDVTDEQVVKDLDFYSHGDDSQIDIQEGDIQRKLFVANIETGQIIYRKSLVIEKENKSEVYFAVDFFAERLLQIALTGKYFVCIGRPDRIGEYLEQKEKFDFEDIDKLIGR